MKQPKPLFLSTTAKKRSKRVDFLGFLPYLCTRKIKAIARVAKLVDAPDLGSGVLRRVGSSPITRTIGQKRNSQKREFLFFCCKIDNASSKRSRGAPRQWCRVGCEKRVLSIFKNKIDNASSKRSREAPRQWRRVGRDKTALSI